MAEGTSGASRACGGRRGFWALVPRSTAGCFDREGPQCRSSTMPEVVTAGETMVLGVPAMPGRLRHAAGLELRSGGAESNVAIALSRLGLSAGWAGYLSADEPGQIVLDRIRGEGGDTSRGRGPEEARTGRSPAGP